MAMDAKGENRCQRLFRENKLLIICLITFGIAAGTFLIFVISILLVREVRLYRLPTDVIPYHYEVEVKPYLTPGNGEFEGQVEIHVTCVRKTDTIMLHSKRLAIVEESVKVTNVDEGDNSEVLSIDYYLPNDLLLLKLFEDLKERNRYRIRIKYRGQMDGRFTGLYITTYEDDDGATHYVASTQLEPCHARTVFPCFDEPQFKSTFNVTLVRLKNMTSLSNMPRSRTEYRGEDWKADVFEKSMKMSTYLVAFVFCDYVGTTKDKITVWSPVHRRENAEFALNVSSRILQFFERKLEIPYAGPKIDMVPVALLRGGAMENWGLIIYQQNYFLTRKDKKDTVKNLNEIAATIAHEIAHQWYGNLVTPKWWSDIWLNEGISSYMEDLVMAKLFPELNQVDPPIVSAYTFLEVDCLDAGPSVWKPVTSKKDEGKIFNSVTYKKGNGITRMAHQILGEEVFWKGMKTYLNSNAYRNVEEADLWRFLTEAQTTVSGNLNLSEIMYPWTHLSGIPIVTINRDYNRKTATILQESCKLKIKDHEFDVWNIPIIFETKYAANLFNKTIWLKERNMTIEGMPERDEWIIANGDKTGNYLVNYDRNNWNLLIDQLRLNHKVFSITQRYVLLNEIIELERMDYVEVDMVFQFLLYLKRETEFRYFWYSFRLIVKYLNFFDETKYYELQREFILYIWKDIYDKFGWKEESYDRSLEGWELVASSNLTKTLCELKYRPCLEEALARYSNLKDEKSITSKAHGNANWIALCTIVQNATYEEWKKIKEINIFENDDKLTFVLECSNDLATIRRELSGILEGSQGIVEWIINSLSYNTASFNELINFFDEHFEIFKEKGFEFFEIQERAVDKKVLNVYRAEKIIKTFSEHFKDLSGSNAENVESFLETLKMRLPALEKKTSALKKWLDGRPWLDNASFFHE